MDMNLYPDSLIPKEGIYKERIDLEALKSRHDFHISRRIDSAKEESTYMEDGNLKLRPSVIASFDSRASMNLLGAGFLIENTILHITEDAAKPWDNQKIDKMIYADNVCIKQNAFAAVFRASSVFRQHPIERTLDSKENTDALENKLRKIQETIYKRLSPKNIQTSSRSFIIHSPTKLNYWHIEFQIQPTPAEPALKSNTKSKWANTLLNMYRELCFSDLEDIIQDDVISIEDEWYYV
jgi:hypothetical protein